MIQVLIDNIDRTSLINWKTFRVKQDKDDGIDTCDLEIKIYGDKTFIPEFRQDVKVKEDGLVIFAGTIQRIKQSIDRVQKVIVYQVECSDYSAELAGILVSKTYESKQTDYPYYRTITIDNTATASDLTDYQININLDSGNFDFTKAKTDGSDLRFYDGTTSLSYWIESYDASGQTASIWVKVLSIPASSTHDIIMKYGNADAINESSIDNVMDSGLRYFYYSGTNFDNLLGTDIDLSIQYINSIWPPVVLNGNSWETLSEYVSIKWKGWVINKGTGNHTFYTTSDDGARVYINEALVVNGWVDQGMTEYNGTVSLSEPAKIDFEWYQGGGGAGAELGWTPADGSGKVYPIPSENLRCSKYTATEPTNTVGTENTAPNIDWTINKILDDLCVSFAPSFNADNANSTFVIPKITFNQVYFNLCIKQLANIVNYSFYIDENKSIHFFNTSEGSAPFSISDEGGYEFNTLKRTLDGSQMVNTVKVRGGTYLANFFTDSITVSGVNSLSFVISKKLSNITVKLNGVSQTVGIDGKDDPATKDVLYNYNDQSLTFPTVKADGDIIEYSGQPTVRVFQIAEDTESISKYGKIEKLIQDDNIKDNIIARKRAVAELYTYASGIIDAEFQTRQSGLRVGQSILVNCPQRNFVENLTIKSIKFKTDSPTSFRYSVSLVNTKRATLINLLSKLLEPKTLNTNETEVSEEIKIDRAVLKISEEHIFVAPFQNNEILKIVDIHSLNPLGDGVEPLWVLAPYFPTGFTDPKRVGRLDISLKLY